jgi:hypothetical protein
VLGSAFGFCLLGSGCLAVVAAVAPPTTTTPPVAKLVDDPAPTTTAEQIVLSTPENPYTAEAVIAAFKVTGLEVPNPRDATDELCADLECSAATETDIFTIHEWRTSDDAHSFRSSHEGERPVAVGDLTTLTFRSGADTPPFDRNLYASSLATLTGQTPATTTTTTEAPTTTTTDTPTTMVPPTTAPPPPPPTQPAPVYVPPPTTAAPAPAPAPSVYYANCAAARAAGVTPIFRGQPGYGAHLDRDSDGVACE